MSAVLNYNYSDHVLLITINRPQSLNAINAAVMQELNAFFKEGHKQYVGLAGVVITGAGDKAFVAGADIKEFSDFDEDQGIQLSKYGNDTFFLIEQFHVPVIAAVNGFALGGGCELAMACHMRIASSNAKFGQPEVNLGLIPGYGGTQRLIQLIGKGKAIEYLLTADIIGAEEAHRLGLVNYVVDVGAEVSKAIDIIKKISTKGPVATKTIIALVNSYFDKQSDGFELECKAFGKALASSECKEGTEAFLQKRKPNFQR